MTATVATFLLFKKKKNEEKKEMFKLNLDSSISVD